MNEKNILLAHGAGGILSRTLLEEEIIPILGNPLLNQLHDGIILDMATKSVAFTTDSYVVNPIFFGKKSIGHLAVSGTVNDLAMTGAVPRYLSLAFIIEEGFPLEDFRRILRDIKEVATEAEVYIVTGDTKVVERNRGTSIFINTGGIGERIANVSISAKNVHTDMDIIVSGYLGDHASAIIEARNDLKLEAHLESDAAPLNHLTQKMLQEVPNIAFLRDPTRGGIASTLNELAKDAQVGILLEEDKIPIREEVIGISHILGLDPFTLANEGKLICVVEKEYSEKLLHLMQQDKYGTNAIIIGRTTKENRGKVGLRTTLGSIRLLDMPLGENLPRIC